MGEWWNKKNKGEYSDGPSQGQQKNQTQCIACSQCHRIHARTARGEKSVRDQTQAIAFGTALKRWRLVFGIAGREEILRDRRAVFTAHEGEHPFSGTVALPCQHGSDTSALSCQ